MVQEVQKLLWQLVCYTGNKSVVMSFVKGCLDNIKVNRYGIFVLIPVTSRPQLYCKNFQFNVLLFV